MPDNGFFSWDGVTPLNNGSADSQINWAENQAPSTVNNSARANMMRHAQRRAELAWPAAGGTANAITLTPGNVITSYADGMVYTFTAGAADNSTTTPTLAVSGLAAITIKKVVAGALAALAAGDIKALGRFSVVYNAAGTAFVLVNPATLGDGTQILMVDAGPFVGPTLDLYRLSSSPAVNDILGQITFTGRDSGGNVTTYADMVVAILDPTNGSEDSQLIFHTMIAGVPSPSFGVATNGLFYAKGNITTGTYTPTTTNTTNVASSTAHVTNYSCNGDMVTVSGYVDIDPTAAAVPTQMAMSIPIASNLGAAEDAGGTGADSLGNVWRIIADPVNDRVTFSGTPAGAATAVVSFCFMYRII